MDLKVSSFMSICVRTCLLFIAVLLLVKQAMSSSLRTTSPQHVENTLWSKQRADLNGKKCGGLLYADLTVQAIEIPKVQSQFDSVYCEWTIRSPKPGLNIGIAPIEHLINFESNQTFKMDIYDGPSADYQRLLHWHQQTDFIHFSQAEVSTRNSIFVNCTMNGGGPLDLEVKIIYYLCGGLIIGESPIASPIFNTKSIYSVPSFLECTWTLKKPLNMRYGYVQFFNVSLPHCGSLFIKSDRGKLISVIKSKNDTKKYIVSNRMGLFSKERMSFFERYQRLDDFFRSNFSSATTVNSSENIDEVVSTTQEVGICNDDVQGIAFDNTAANLTFTIVYPEHVYGINAYYHILHSREIPNRKVNDQSKWFRNYGAVIVFVPVGIVIGLLLICFQQHKWKSFFKTAVTYNVHDDLVEFPPASNDELLSSEDKGENGEQKLALNGTNSHHVETSRFDNKEIILEENQNSVEQMPCLSNGNTTVVTSCNANHKSRLISDSTISSGDVAFLTQDKETPNLKKVTFEIG